jgi:sarcosine oxidase subunit gamma
MQTMQSPQYTLQSTLAAQALEGPVSITFLPDTARFNLRLAESDVTAASAAFGVSLPTTIGEATRSEQRSALCLGPDEWVLYTEETDADALESASGQLYESVPHSFVDISNREVAFSLTGRQAITLLSVGCPTDLRDMPIGSGRRTVFDGATVVIHRAGPDDFCMEVWRSFLPHIWEVLNIANRELETGY